MVGMAFALTVTTGRVVVLDVREPDEYEQGAVPGSLHIPRGQLDRKSVV